jgi:hypothetical protein
MLTAKNDPTVIIIHPIQANQLNAPVSAGVLARHSCQGAFLAGI